MLHYITEKVGSFLSNDDTRTGRLRKNIGYSFLLKVGSVGVTFALVPLTLGYVDASQYGLWLTISSMVYWINVFDIGIGNGLKNELAYSIAIKDESKVRTYVSTTYATLGILASLIFVFSLIVNHFLDWHKILSLTPGKDYHVRSLVLIVLTFFCFQFVLQLMDAILSATQQVFKSSLILFIGQVLGLFLIYLATLFLKQNILILVVVLAGAPVLSLLVASIYLFNTNLRAFAPRLSAIDFTYAKRLLNVGGVFFVIQIGAMFLIHSNNFIISHVLGPEAVTMYNIPFRMFSFLSMLFAIVIMPYWSAFTDAYTKHEFEWIKANIRKLRALWLTLALSGIGLLLIANYLYKIWIGDAVVVPFSLSAYIFLYVVVYMWHTLHVYFLNGIGKIRLQLVVVLLGVIINLPLAIFLGSHFGLNGIIISNIFVFTAMGLIYTIQYQKIINNTARGLWNF